MTKYEAVAVEAFVSGINRTCYMIVDTKTKEPYFPASVWLLNEYNRKLNSYKKLAQRIALFLNFCMEKGYDPLRFRNHQFEYWLDGYLFQGDGDETKQRDASTVMQYGSSIVTFYKGLRKLGFASNDLEIPHTFQNERLQRRSELVTGSKNSLDPFGLFEQVLDDIDFKTLIGYMPHKSAKIRARNTLIMKVAYETGCRASEIVNPHNFSKSRLHRDMKAAKDKNESHFLFTVIGKGRGAGKTRKISMPVDLADEIFRYLKRYEIAGDVIFTSSNEDKDGKPIPLGSGEPTRIFKKCRDALIAANDEAVVDRERLDLWNLHMHARVFHSLRHSYATNLVNKLARKVPEGSSLYKNWEYVRERMGHSQLATTRGYVAYELSLNGMPEEQSDFLLEHELKLTDEMRSEMSGEDN